MDRSDGCLICLYQFSLECLPIHLSPVEKGFKSTAWRMMVSVNLKLRSFLSNLQIFCYVMVFLWQIKILLTNSCDFFGLFWRNSFFSKAYLPLSLNNDLKNWWFYFVYCFLVYFSFLYVRVWNDNRYSTPSSSLNIKIDRKRKTHEWERERNWMSYSVRCVIRNNSVCSRFV